MFKVGTMVIAKETIYGVIEGEIYRILDIENGNISGEFLTVIDSHGVRYEGIYSYRFKPYFYKNNNTMYY